MKEKDRNRGLKQEDFLRYRKGEMTGLEKNAFEKNLQRDPFAEEAYEGLSEISSHEAASDLRKLERQLKNRITKKSRMIYYRIAASVAVLMILSSVFIVLEKTKPSQQISDLSGEKSILEITEPQAITHQKPEVAIPREKSASASGKIEKGAPEEQKPAIPEKQNSKIQSDDRSVAGLTGKSDVIQKPLVKNMEINVADKKAAPLAANAGAKEVSPFLIRGRIISADDNLPLPGAIVKLEGSDKAVLSDKEGNFSMVVPADTGQKLVAQYIGMIPQEFSTKRNEELEVRMTPDAASLDEVVVVGYGMNRKTGTIDAETNGYKPPSPVNGKSNFNKYVENNIRRPSILAKGERAVVILSFEIKSTGTIDSIKVIRSPDKVFSDEAIRLVREGPAWNPASSGGKNIDDDVRLRIVFK